MTSPECLNIRLSDYFEARERGETEITPTDPPAIVAPPDGERTAESRQDGKRPGATG